LLHNQRAARNVDAGSRTHNQKGRALMPADQLQTKPALRRTIACVVLALALSACDDDDESTKVTTTFSFAPSPAIAATIGQPSFIPTDPCAATFVIVISAFETIDVDGFTLRLMDGSVRGLPVVPVPKPELTRQFGSTLVVAGTSMSFPFQPQFPCDVTPQAVAADIAFVNARGVMQNFTVERPFR
jgi:hypothetical protein